MQIDVDKLMFGYPSIRIRSSATKIILILQVSTRSYFKEHLRLILNLHQPINNRVYLRLGRLCSARRRPGCKNSQLWQATGIHRESIHPWLRRKISSCSRTVTVTVGFHMDFHMDFLWCKIWKTIRKTAKMMIQPWIFGVWLRGTIFSDRLYGFVHGGYLYTQYTSILSFFFRGMINIDQPLWGTRFSKKAIVIRGNIYEDCVRN